MYHRLTLPRTPTTKHGHHKERPYAMDSSLYDLRPGKTNVVGLKHYRPVIIVDYLW